MDSWLALRDEVIREARRVAWLHNRRTKAARYVVPFFALAVLAVAVADLDEDEKK